MKIRKIFDNIEIKLICLLLAIVMWLYAKPEGMEIIDKLMAVISRGDQERITFPEVPIALVGLPEQWGADRSTISLEVKSLVAEIETSNFRAVVKVTPKDVEERWVALTADNVTLPEGLGFVRAEPNKIKIAPKL